MPEDSGLGAEMLMHDRDTKFTAAFDEVLKSANVRVVKSALRAPNTNAFVERYIQTLHQEVLDYFVVFGEQHMDHLVSDAVAHYHQDRPHQGKDNALLMTAPTDSGTQQPKPPPDVIPVSQIECRQRLGGLLKSYHRRAA